jgi:hypothetical protein
MKLTVVWVWLMPAYVGIGRAPAGFICYVSPTTCPLHRFLITVSYGKTQEEKTSRAQEKGPP